MYAKYMTIVDIAEYFCIQPNTYRSWLKKGIDARVAYDAFQNMKTLRRKKRWLYDQNTEKNRFALGHGSIENIMDSIWEGYMQRLEIEQQLKEERYESGDTNWKLNQRFGS
jgi:uncharacterized protein YjcR